MRYLISLFVGVLVGIALFAAGLYYNPFLKRQTLSPLSVTDNPVMNLQYSAVPSDALVYTNDGEASISPHPAKVLQLWEPTVRQTRVRVATLHSGNGDFAGLGIKFASDSDDTRLLDGKAMVNSEWHVYLPGRGSLFIGQTENYWDYLRGIVLPAYWSSGDSWRGAWSGTTTAGPGALATGLVTGGSGEFAAISSLAVESLSARAYSSKSGPVAMTGELAIELPVPVTEQVPDP